MFGQDIRPSAAALPTRPTMGRRGLVLGLLGLAALPAHAAHPRPAGTRYFRIAAGPAQSRYFQVGTALAEAISAPFGLRTCGRDRVCGVAGLIGIATATNGPLDNFRLVTSGHVEAGLMPARLFAAAQRGAKGSRQGDADTALRVLAPLYAELAHLVVLADSPILQVADLRGRRICVGDDSSGGPYLAQQILAAAGLRGRHVKTSELSLAEAAESLIGGRIDAFFCVEGPPSPTIDELSSRAAIRLIPIGTEYGLAANVPMTTEAVIPDGVYRGVGRTPTLGLTAVWAGHAGLDAELVYAITRAAWHAGSRVLRSTIAAGSAADLLRQVEGFDLPFHPGARQFYRDAGMPS